METGISWLVTQVVQQLMYESALDGCVWMRMYVYKYL